MADKQELPERLRDPFKVIERGRMLNQLLEQRNAAWDEIERLQRLRREGATYIAGLQREIKQLRDGLKKLAGDRSDGPTRRIAQAILDGSSEKDHA